MIIDGYRLKMYAHCGMAYEIDSTDDDTLDGRFAMRDAAQRFIESRLEHGYDVSDLKPQGDEILRYELTEPDDAAMVPDDAGLLIVEPIPAKTYECYICGCEQRIGQECCPEIGWDEDIDADLLTEIESENNTD